MKCHLRWVFHVIVLRRIFDALFRDVDQLFARLDAVDFIAQQHQKLRHPSWAASHFEETSSRPDVHRFDEVHQSVDLREELVVPRSWIVRLPVEPFALESRHLGHVLPGRLEKAFGALLLVTEKAAVSGRLLGCGELAFLFSGFGI